jgi:hypothetical protein
MLSDEQKGNNSQLELPAGASTLLRALLALNSFAVFYVVFTEYIM